MRVGDHTLRFYPYLSYFYYKGTKKNWNMQIFYVKKSLINKKKICTIFLRIIQITIGINMNKNLIVTNYYIPPLLYFSIITL